MILWESKREEKTLYFLLPELFPVRAGGDVARDVPKDPAAALHDILGVVMKEVDQKLQSPFRRTNIGL